MHISKLSGLNHDVLYGACDAYDLLILVVLGINWLEVASYLLLYNSTRWLHE